jgi:hypothetical protein
MCRARSDLGRHFFADLNFDGFRGLQVQFPLLSGELVHTQSTTTNNRNKLVMYQSNPRVPIPPRLLTIFENMQQISEGGVEYVIQLPENKENTFFDVSSKCSPVNISSTVHHTLVRFAVIML